MNEKLYVFLVCAFAMILLLGFMLRNLKSLRKLEKDETKI
tara:strand:- start:353 stop:472 length:120 start_codon:yes stop_codon:yes gene_type:complete